MRLSSQNNQFRFNFPSDFLSQETHDRLKRFMDKNWIPYDDPIDFLNSTIKEIVYPSISYEGSEQTHRFGKKIEYKPSGSIYDTYNNTLDITLRSVDSNANYFMFQQIFAEYYNNTRKYFLPWIDLEILDKDGDVLYSVVFRSPLFKSLSEVRLMYQAVDVSENTFSVTFKFNFIDIFWELSEKEKRISENIFDTETWDHSKDVLPRERSQNDYPELN